MPGHLQKHAPLNGCFQHVTNDHEISIRTIADKIRGRTQVIVRHNGMIGNSAHDYVQRPKSKVQRPTPNVHREFLTSQVQRVQRPTLPTSNNTATIQRSTSTSERPNVRTSNGPESNVQRPNGQFPNVQHASSNVRCPTFNVEQPNGRSSNVQRQMFNVKCLNVPTPNVQRPTR